MQYPRLNVKDTLKAWNEIFLWPNQFTHNFNNKDYLKNNKSIAKSLHFENTYKGV